MKPTWTYVVDVLKRLALSLCTCMILGHVVMSGDDSIRSITQIIGDDKNMRILVSLVPSSISQNVSKSITSIGYVYDRLRDVQGGVSWTYRGIICTEFLLKCWFAYAIILSKLLSSLYHLLGLKYITESLEVLKKQNLIAFKDFLSVGSHVGEIGFGLYQTSITELALIWFKCVCCVVVLWISVSLLALFCVKTATKILSWVNTFSSVSESPKAIILPDGKEIDMASNGPSRRSSRVDTLQPTDSWMNIFRDVLASTEAVGSRGMSKSSSECTANASWEQSRSISSATVADDGIDEHVKLSMNAHAELLGFHSPAHMSCDNMNRELQQVAMSQESELASLRQALASAHEIECLKDRKIEKITAEKEDYVISGRSQISQIKQLSRNVHEMSAEIQEKQSEIRALLERASVAESAAQKACSRVSSLTDDLEAARNANVEVDDRLKLCVKQSLHDIAKVQKEANGLRDRLKICETVDIKRMQNHIRDLKKSYKVLAEDKESFQLNAEKDIQEIEYRNAQLVKEIEMMREQVKQFDTAKSTINSLSEELRVLEDESQSYKQAIDSYKQSIEKYKYTVDTLLMKLANEKNLRNEAESALVGAIQDFERVDTILTRKYNAESAAHKETLRVLQEVRDEYVSVTTGLRADISREVEAHESTKKNLESVLEIRSVREAKDLKDLKDLKELKYAKDGTGISETKSSSEVDFHMCDVYESAKKNGVDESASDYVLDAGGRVLDAGGRVLDTGGRRLTHLENELSSARRAALQKVEVLLKDTAGRIEPRNQREIAYERKSDFIDDDDDDDDTAMVILKRTASDGSEKVGRTPQPTSPRDRPTRPKGLHRTSRGKGRPCRSDFETLRDSSAKHEGRAPEVVTSFINEDGIDPRTHDEDEGSHYDKCDSACLGPHQSSPTKFPTRLPYKQGSGLRGSHSSSSVSTEDAWGSTHRTHGDDGDDGDDSDDKRNIPTQIDASNVSVYHTASPLRGSIDSNLSSISNISSVTVTESYDEYMKAGLTSSRHMSTHTQSQSHGRTYQPDVPKANEIRQVLGLRPKQNLQFTKPRSIDAMRSSSGSSYSAAVPRTAPYSKGRGDSYEVENSYDSGVTHIPVLDTSTCVLSPDSHSRSDWQDQYSPERTPPSISQSQFSRRMHKQYGKEPRGAYKSTRTPTLSAMTSYHNPITAGSHDPDTAAHTRLLHRSDRTPEKKALIEVDDYMYSPMHSPLHSAMQ